MDITLLSKYIGNTPLIELKKLSNEKCKVYAKLEFLNLFGSVKDRPAFWMIKNAILKGYLNNNRILIEPTSGNMGIALAGICNLLKIKCEMVVPSKISDETKDIIRKIGANILETLDDLCPRVGKGTDQSIHLAKSLVKSNPNAYYMPNQYENEVNVISHYETTAKEIWESTKGKITHFITGIGTGGTIAGVGKFLKERKKECKIIAIEPQKNHRIQGLRNLEESMMPKILMDNVEYVDDWIKVKDDEAFEEVVYLAEKENLLVGPSSGAILAGFKKIQEKEGIFVLIFADDGRKYKSLYKELGIFNENKFEFYLKKSKYIGKDPLNALNSLL